MLTLWICLKYFVLRLYNLTLHKKVFQSNANRLLVHRWMYGLHSEQVSTYLGNGTRGITVWPGMERDYFPNGGGVGVGVRAEGVSCMLRGAQIWG